MKLKYLLKRSWNFFVEAHWTVKAFLSAIILGVAGFITLCVMVFFPLGFSAKTITIEKGTTSIEAAHLLKENNIINSTLIFRIILRVQHPEDRILAGDYSFNRRQNTFTIVSRLIRGDFRMGQKKVTIPEGSTNEQIASYLKEAYPDFDTVKFLDETEGKQGYLFPDTYYFEGTSTEEVIGTLEEHFHIRVRDIQAEALSLEKDWDDIVTMASILEEEADNVVDFGIVSGILWKRIEIGMGLQVDVAPETYEVRGLPKEPLSNPGLEALKAAANPTKSEYLYYLTGRDGMMHYAEDFEKHKANVQKYLRK